jgi:NADPH:quinone reductase-like Zn-dependent oxidoreductase
MPSLFFFFSMTVLTEQTVYRITDLSGIESVKAIKEPLTTELDRDDVLVKIMAVSLNYRDLAVTNATYPFPFSKNVIVGSDSAGKIVKIGSNVSHLQIGDRVINIFDSENLYGTQLGIATALGANTDGVICQYKVFNKVHVNKLPKDSHLSDEEAFTLTCAGVTA